MFSIYYAVSSGPFTNAVQIILLGTKRVQQMVIGFEYIYTEKNVLRLKPKVLIFGVSFYKYCLIISLELRDTTPEGLKCFNRNTNRKSLIKSYPLKTVSRSVQSHLKFFFLGKTSLATGSLILKRLICILRNFQMFFPKTVLFIFGT